MVEKSDIFSKFSSFEFFENIILDVFFSDKKQWLSRIVGRYRRVVGCYRRKVSKLESTRPGLFRTPKNMKIGPIATENDKNEKGSIFFNRNGWFSLIFLFT